MRLFQKCSEPASLVWTTREKRAKFVLSLPFIAFCSTLDWGSDIIKQFKASYPHQLMPLSPQMTQVSIGLFQKILAFAFWQNCKFYPLVFAICTPHCSQIAVGWIFEENTLYLFVLCISYIVISAHPGVPVISVQLIWPPPSFVPYPSVWGKLMNITGCPFALDPDPP